MNTADKRKLKTKLSKQEIINNLSELVKSNEYMKLLGIEVLSLSPELAEGRMPYQDLTLNPYGSVHGGCLFSLADIMSGLAASAHGKYCSTVSGNMNFIQPAMNTKYVYCKAEEVRFGVKIAVYQVTLSDDHGDVLENGSFTFYVGSHHVGEID